MTVYCRIREDIEEEIPPCSLGYIKINYGVWRECITFEDKQNQEIFPDDEFNMLVKIKVDRGNIWVAHKTIDFEFKEI